MRDDFRNQVGKVNAIGDRVNMETGWEETVTRAWMPEWLTEDEEATVPQVLLTLDTVDISI
jgi:hypothetical protein